MKDNGVWGLGWRVGVVGLVGVVVVACVGGDDDTGEVAEEVVATLDDHAPDEPDVDETAEAVDGGVVDGDDDVEDPYGDYDPSLAGLDPEDFAIPEVITAEYLQDVLEVLFVFERRSLEFFREDGEVTDRVRTEIEHIYSYYAVDGFIEALEFTLERHPDLSLLRDDLQDPEVTVLDVIEARRNCSLVEIDRDKNAAYFKELFADQRLFFVVQPHNEVDPGTNPNPTPMKISRSPSTRGEDVENLCESVPD